MNVTDWVIAVSSAVSATAVLAIWIQTRTSAASYQLLVTQIASDHERSRRENAVRLLFQWSQSLNKKTSTARRLAESLTVEQVRSLFTEDSLTLGIANLVDVRVCLDDPDEFIATEELVIGKREIVLTGCALKEIKWQVVRYLNLLESVFAARRFNTADREILDEQFGYLVSTKDGKDVLGALRRALGGPTALPAIEEFAREQIHLHEKLPAGKEPVK